MKPDIRQATTEKERDDVFRFRYQIYVEEMGRYKSIADHARRMLIEPEDASARIYYAVDDDEKLVATMRLNWGGDSSISERQIEQYRIAPFLETVPAKQLIVGERIMVIPELRGSDLIYRLFQTYLNFVNSQRIQLIFGDCEPHLLNLYLGMGFRTYSANNVNSRETGYLIPLVMVPEDLAYMRHINSGLQDVLKDFGSDALVPHCVSELIDPGGTVLSQTLAPGEVYLTEIEQAIQLAENPANLFDGLSEEEEELCLKKSNAITCQAGDHLIKMGNVAQNMFVVLEGTLEVMVGGKIIYVCGSGDVVGEMSFLLENSRSADVYVATDHTRVLSLSESNLKKLIAVEPELAAKLLLNLSKVLCHKLLRR